MITGMKKDRHLPPRVFPHGRWYCLVRAEGSRRVWVPLSLIEDGLPAMYAALARLTEAAARDDRMPAVIADWQATVMPKHAAKTQIDDRRMCGLLAEAFAEFRACEVTTADAQDYLDGLADKPRTHNAHRSLLRELLRFAATRGHRNGVNPVDDVRTISTPARKRYLTDSEVRRIKVGACYGDDDKPTRSGRMIALMLDLQYLTGQRIGDVLDLRWQRDPDNPDAPHVTAEGLRFRPAKTRKSTGAAVMIEWTPRLREVVARIKQMQAERLLKRKAGQRVVSGWLITGQDGTPLSYWGASSAFRRAAARAGIKDARLNDQRARAITDKDRTEGRQAARAMGNHTTEQQTQDYIRHMLPTKTKATR